MNITGRAVPHESAHGHVSGEALYTSDLVPRFSNLLHAWPVCAPHAHALVTSIAIDAACEEPGVVRVMTGSDVPGEGNSGSNRHDEPLFPEEVMYHGQPVAWVLGDTLDAAQRGARRIEVRYAVLPAVLTIEQAMEEHSYLSEPIRLADGDMSGLDACHLQFDGELMMGGQEHFYLETQASVAWIDESGAMMVHSSTQHPAETQEVVAPSG